MPILPELVDWAKNNPVDPISLQPAIIDPGNTLKDDGFPQQYVVPRQDLNFLHSNSAQWQKVFVSSLKDHINGFRIISTLIAIPPANSHIKISHGTAMSDDGLQFYDTQVETSIWGATEAQKNLFLGGSSSFVEGGGNPGLSSSLTFTNLTFYHTFIFININGDTDIGFDDDIQASNLIADHNILHPRRINSWNFLSGVGMVNLEQYGDYFHNGGNATTISAALLDNTNNAGAFQGVSGISPTDIDVVLEVHVQYQVTTPTTPAIPLIAISSVLGLGNNTILVDGTAKQSFICKIPVNRGDQRLKYTHNISAGDILATVKLIGWHDTRGRDWGSGSTSIPGQFWP